MTRLVAGELLKLRTTRLGWGLLLAVAGLTALQVGLTASFAGKQGAPGLDTDEGVRSVWAGAGAGTVLALVVGVIVITGEYRSQTITATFLASPHRSRVIGAKLVTAGVVGTLYGAAACAVAAAIAVPVLAASDATGRANVTAMLGGSLLATALYAVAGVGVGALVRNQVAVIVGALVWVLVLEALVVAFLPRVGKWLPGGAASALLQAPVPGAPGASLLSPWAGGLLFLGYGVALAALGARFAVRRDVT